MKTSRDPIINCHTHIFKGEHVPPFLAKSFIFWPACYAIYLPVILGGFKVTDSMGKKIRFSSWYRRLEKEYARLKRPAIMRLLGRLVAAWITLQVFFILFDTISLIVQPAAAIGAFLEKNRRTLLDYYILLPFEPVWLKTALVLFLLLFIKWGRNLILFIFKSIWGFFRVLPGKMSVDLLKRYLLIGRFTLYKTQSGILYVLKNQYPADTRFVILPMDMEFMDAGGLAPDACFEKQMEDLAFLKANPKYADLIYPFVFIDPRRMKKEKERFFNYNCPGNGRVELEPCFIKSFIEDKKFSGFKIYPALGYYPFDPALLPLWKYAADHGLPVTAHCIRGTIFYRGKKRREWYVHPVFEQSDGKGALEPLQLPEEKNEDFTVNFTHPLNYLCLLDEPLLRKVVGRSGDEMIRQLFGYHGDNTPLDHNLHHLKINFAHFGGEDQWERYLEKDRYNYSLQLNRYPDRGIEFFVKNNGERSAAKMEHLWKYADWYSVICSLMLQYPNVYADISYILHDEKIFPLLRQTLRHPNPKLAQRVLFGTDFYVVRNHKSEKQLLADTMAKLSDTEFDQIARENPKAFLGI